MKKFYLITLFCIFPILFGTSVFFARKNEVHVSKEGKKTESIVWRYLEISENYVKIPDSLEESGRNGRVCQNLNQLNISSVGDPPKITEVWNKNINSQIVGIAWSPDGRYIATSENLDRIVRVWSFPGMNLKYTIYKSVSGSGDVLFTKDSRFLITSPISLYSKEKQNSLSIIDLESGVLYKNVVIPNNFSNFYTKNLPFHFILSNNGKLLFVYFRGDDKIYVYNTSVWSVVDQIPSVPGSMQAGPGDEELTILRLPPMLSGLSESDWSKLGDEIQIWSESSHELNLNNYVFSSSFWPLSMSIDGKSCSFYFGSYYINKNNQEKNSIDGIKVLSIGNNILQNLPSVPPVYHILYNSKFNLLYFSSQYQNIGVFYLKKLGTKRVEFANILSFKNNIAGIVFSPDSSEVLVAGDSSMVLLKMESSQ